MQTPVSLDPIGDATVLSEPRPKGTGTLAGAALPDGAVLEVALRFEADPDAILSVRLSNAAGETLVASFDSGSYPGFPVSRSTGAARGFRHRYMVDKAIWSAPQETTATDMRLIVDRSSIELFGMDGEASGTMLQYFASPPDRLEIVADGG